MDLGEISRHALPATIDVTMTDETGAVLDDLTGFSAEFIYGLVSATTASTVTAPVTITDPDDAVVRLNFAADLGGGTYLTDTAGTYMGQVWVGNGANRYPSERIYWRVDDSASRDQTPSV